MTKPNIILVHGFWTDGSCWSQVVLLLQRRNYDVVAVQNSFRSLQDDAAATRRAIKQSDGPVILVGHCWGGVVITEAGDEPEVAALVYIAAFGLTAGSSLATAASIVPPYARSFDNRKDGYIRLDRSTFRTCFCPDVPIERADMLAAMQSPVAARIFGDRLTVASWRFTPSWYLVSTEDRMIGPDAQRAMARQMFSTTAEVRSSHLPMISNPVPVATLIIRAAEHVAPRR